MLVAANGSIAVAAVCSGVSFYGGCYFFGRPLIEC